MSEIDFGPFFDRRPLRVWVERSDDNGATWRVVLPVEERLTLDLARHVVDLCRDIGGPGLLRVCTDAIAPVGALSPVDESAGRLSLATGGELSVVETDKKRAAARRRK